MESRNFRFVMVEGEDSLFHGVPKSVTVEKKPGKTLEELLASIVAEEVVRNPYEPHAGNFPLIRSAKDCTVRIDSTNKRLVIRTRSES